MDSWELTLDEKINGCRVLTFVSLYINILIKHLPNETISKELKILYSMHTYIIQYMYNKDMSDHDMDDSLYQLRSDIKSCMRQKIQNIDGWTYARMILKSQFVVYEVRKILNRYGIIVIRSKIDTIIVKHIDVALLDIVNENISRYGIRLVFNDFFKIEKKYIAYRYECHVQ